MPKQTKKKLRVMPWLLSGVLAMGALGYYVKTSGADKVAAQDRASEQSLSPASSAGDRTVHVVQPHSQGMELSYSHTDKEAPVDQDPNVYAVNEYLRQVPAVDPKGKVLAVDIKDRIANLSMSKEFATSYGSEDEKLILDGIATTLGAIDGIDKFTLSMDGERIDSLGHADLSDPMPVIRKDGSSKPSEALAPSKPR